LLFSRTHHRSSLQDITNDCPIEVNTRIVRQALHNHGILSRIAINKPFLTPLHISQQLDFARWYCEWNAKDWECVCWTDKSTFKISKNSRQVHIWRTTYEQYSSSYVVSTFKSGRTFLMIWDGFVGDKKSKFVFMPKDWYKASDFVKLVFNGQLLQFMGKVSHAILMEDGALVHQNKVFEEWRKLSLIEKLKWPANTPDLNPLENVCKLFKNVVQHSQSCPKTLEELKVFLERDWTLVNCAKLRTLYHIMLGRL
jgi:hypothetical protein